MNKAIKILIASIVTIILCYFAHKWNCYDVIILYFLILLYIEGLDSNE